MLVGGVQEKPIIHGEKKPRTRCLKDGHREIYESRISNRQEVRAQSCLKAELTSGEKLTPAVFEAQAPVEFVKIALERLQKENPRFAQRPLGKKRISQPVADAAHACSSSRCQGL